MVKFDWLLMDPSLGYCLFVVVRFLFATCSVSGLCMDVYSEFEDCLMDSFFMDSFGLSDF